jgi:MFS family permease
VAAALAWDAAQLNRTSYAWLVPAYIAMGIGIGMVMSPTNTDAVNAAAPNDRGEASGVIQTLPQIGGSVGLALMGTVVSSVQQDHINAFVQANPGTDPASIERVLSESGAARPRPAPRQT